MAGRSGLTLVEASAVSKSFGGVKVLSDLSFEIKSGDFIVLRGGNGSGKTTILNILSGLLIPDSGTITLDQGDRHPARFAFGQRHRHRVARRFFLGAMARHGVLRSWQDVRLFSTLSLADNLNVAAPDQIGESLMPVLFRPSAVRERERSVSEVSTRMLESFGLNHLARDAERTQAAVRRDGSKRIATGVSVSLGEAKRVAMARSLRGDSRVLLLDEPLSGLDARGIGSVVGFLRALNRDDGLTMLVVEHESTVEHLTGLATETWRLEGGRISRRCAAVASADELTFLDNWKRGVMRSDETERAAALPNGARLTVIAPPDRSGRKDMLELNEVSVVRGGRPVFAPFSLRIPRGALAILEAPNGWGKTTLVEAVAGLRPFDTGDMLLDGVRRQRDEPWTRRRHGLTLLQSRGTSFPKLTVREALEVCSVKSVPPYLTRLLDRTVSSLSGGERQRVLFACSQGGTRPRLTIWDEPFVGLDESGVDMLTQAVRERAEDQTLLILLPAFTRHDGQTPMEES